MISVHSAPRVLGLVTALAVLLSPAVRAQEPRLTNISTRAPSGIGADVLTAGFVIGPGANKPVLIRAIGPTLSSFGLTGTLADPVLTLFNSTNTALATNDNWLAADAPTFASVGAFALPPNSRDSALIVTLAPGNYTAQIAGAGTTTGLALVEVYELSSPGAATATKLLNTSTRLQISPTSAPIIGFVVSPGTGTRKLLLRAAGPALIPFGLTGTLADPTLSLTTSTGTVLASNDNWATPTTVTTTAPAAGAPLLSAAFTSAGAFAFPAGSKDAAVLIDLAPGNYGLQVSGVATTSGLALVEVYDLTSSGPLVIPTAATVTLTATKPTTDESGTTAGEFTLTRSGDPLFALTVNFGVSGSATNGLDYPPLLGTATIPAGATSVKIPLQPFPDTAVEPNETVILTLATGPDYTVGASSAATVTIADSPGTLYVSLLRPAANATGSTASGLATIVLSASGTLATVNVSFSNLSSGQAGAHLFLGNSTSAGDYVLNLPLGQITGAQWAIVPTATFTTAQILSALTNGLIYVGLDTGNFPAGEVRGAFLTATGSQAFTAPAAPPAVALTALTATDAARLLTQATFGPKKSEIDALTGGSVNAWLDAQIALPASSHRARILVERDFNPITLNNQRPDEPFPFHRQSAWFYHALQAPDQLRQRVAFALSQILVVSDVTLAGQQYTEALTIYYDHLATGAFGSFRELLEKVTLSPIMGTYLSSVRNAKADPATGTEPDENYAREIMQLFTIGLVQLQPDGTLQLDAQGLPRPTYDQKTITETAKVFTGWGYFNPAFNAATNAAFFRRGPLDYKNPMMLYPPFHENAAKTIVGPTVIPANLGGPEDLKRTLDALVAHPNTAPFISRQLIQRLVTVNPSPGYVYRVAQQFGPTGDLGAVVRAILTDYEARSPTAATAPGYGKLREPLLRLTALLRSFNAASTSGHYTNYNNTEATLTQAALSAPSVFNFYEPGYVYPGALAAAGLVAPEFQITTDTTAISAPNFLRQVIFLSAPPPNAVGPNVRGTAALNLAPEVALVANVPALLDHLNLIMTAGQMTTPTRARLITAMNALNPFFSDPLDRARTAILLVATSPDGATQR